MVKSNRNKNIRKSYGILQRALKANEEYFGKDSKQVLSLLVDLTDAQKYRKDVDRKKDAYWKRAVKLSKKLNGDDSIEHALVLKDISLYMLLGNEYKHRIAFKYLKKAYEITRNMWGADHPDTAYLAFNIGKYQVSLRRYKDGRPYLEEAKAALDKSGKNISLLNSVRGNLVICYEKMGEPEKATELLLLIGESSKFSNVESYYPIFERRPNYPPKAWKNKDEGYALVEFTVNEEGKVEDIKLVEYQGTMEFYREAKKVISQYRYAPRFKNGIPIKTTGVRKRLGFYIKDNS